MNASTSTHHELQIRFWYGTWDSASVRWRCASYKCLCCYYICYFRFVV